MSPVDDGFPVDVVSSLTVVLVVPLALLPDIPDVSAPPELRAATRGFAPPGADPFSDEPAEREAADDSIGDGDGELDEPDEPDESDDEPADDELDEPSEELDADGSANATQGMVATAVPIPNATASAPTRPILFALPEAAPAATTFRLTVASSSTRESRYRRCALAPRLLRRRCLPPPARPDALPRECPAPAPLTIRSPFAR